MIRLADILQKVESYHPGADLDLVKKAYVFAAKAHDGQMRKSGDPYVTHPLSVASVIAELRLDVPSICAGLLHDSVEDTSTTVEELQEVFGDQVAFLVDGVTKLGKMAWNTREERQAENFRKMLLAMAKDIRVILVKLCDRLDNMRTLEHMSPSKQERIARETMDIYAPLANRLGIMWIKAELEDLAFRYLHPVDFENLERDIAKASRERGRYTREIEKLIATQMEKANISCRVTGRNKHLWSIYSKMKRTGLPMDQIHDFIGFRVITDTVGHCYEALGVSHARWTPVPGRFKDYIALPKPNMYQSLHTTVIGPHAERMEVQIRTEEMHRTAELGVAAHWRYKEGKPGAMDGDESKFAWLRQLMEWQRDLKDPTEFIETVKIDLFANEVYVFTPQGDVKALPKNACPIDFAYAVHSEVGDKCSGSRVNGAIVPLRYKLRNGDTVDIITSPNQKPNKDWLKFVVTSRARNKIRARLRDEERERATGLGKTLIERELRKYNLSFGRAMKEGRLDEAAKAVRAGTVDELIALVGYGKVTPAQIAEKLVPEDQRAKEPKPPSSFTTLLRRVTGRVPTGIQVDGESDIMVRFASCCSPLPGDGIVGFITRGRGVTVHTRDCSEGLDLDPDRRVDVSWDVKKKAPRPVSIQVVCADKPGLLAHISQSFSESGVNISQAQCIAGEDRKAINTFHFLVNDLDHLKNVIRRLQRINGVFSVERVART